ncbi:MAG: hypothetical protein WDZ69_01165 [Candidatus Pacearchaeota archaeon]
MEKRRVNFEKKGIAILLSFFLVLLIFSFVQAQDADGEDEETEEDPIDMAYSCLEENVVDKCSALTTEQKVFSLLAINQCEEELIEESSNKGECWPSGNCDVEITSKAVLALNHVGANTTSAQEWLKSKSEPTEGLDWFIQIESGETSCTLTDDNGYEYNINLMEDKTIETDDNTAAWPGLEISDEGYWLKVLPKFYGRDFKITCDEGFQTNLLFRKSDDPGTIHVFPDFSERSGGDSSNETVESSCFEERDGCSYSGGLWAALVLDLLEEDVSSYLPYLITFKEDNPSLLPDSFLYSITSGDDYKDSLLSEQSQNRWDVSGDEYYDTALALYPLSDNSLREKEDSKEWLLEEQDADGCWQGGNIRNTAFVLESVWPRDFIGSSGSGSENGGDSTIYCEGAGNYCVSSSGECSGEVIGDQVCPGSFSPVCCSQPREQKTCSDIINEHGGDGDVCSSSSQSCQGSQTSDASDLGAGEVCCYGEGAFCKDIPEQEVSECEEQGGECRSSCFRGEEEDSQYSCSLESQVCCMSSSSDEDEGNEEGNLMWVWILGTLIVLVVIGIIFKDKLREFWLKIKSKFGGSKSGSGRGSHGPGRPPGRPGPPPHYPRPRRPSSERRVLPRPQPQQSRPSPRPERKSGASKELDDVLKKLKEMGK